MHSTFLFTRRQPFDPYPLTSGLVARERLSPATATPAQAREPRPPRLDSVLPRPGRRPRVSSWPAWLPSPLPSTTRPTANDVRPPFSPPSPPHTLPLSSPQYTRTTPRAAVILTFPITTLPPRLLAVNLRTGNPYHGGFVFPLGNGDILSESSPAGQYLYSLLSVAIPLWAILAGFLLVYVVFLITRCCCMCVGRSGPCPKPDPPSAANYVPRVFVRLAIALGMASVMVGAVLIYAASTEVPRAVVGTSTSSGLVDVVLVALDRMVTVAKGMQTSAASASTSILAAVNRLAAVIAAEPLTNGFTLNTTTIQVATDGLNAGLTDMVTSLQALRDGMASPVASLSGFLTLGKLGMFYTAVAIPVVAFLVGAFALAGYRTSLVLGFVVFSPVLVLITIVLGALGLTAMTFFSDICVEAGAMHRIFVTEGPSAANETSLGTLLQCAPASTFTDPLRTLFQSGNIGVQMAHLAVSMDLTNDYVQRGQPNPYTPTRHLVCYRYDPACSPDVKGATASLGQQCVGACSYTVAEATGYGDTSEFTSLLTTVTGNSTSNSFTPTATMGRTWATAMNLDANNWANPTPTASYAAYTDAQSFTYAAPLEIHDDVMGFLSSLESLLGGKDGASSYVGLEYLVRCEYVEQMLYDLTTDMCPVMIKALEVLWLGFGVAGAGLTLMALGFLAGMCYLDRKAGSRAKKVVPMPMDGDTDRDGALFVTPRAKGVTAPVRKSPTTGRKIAFETP